MTSVNRRTSILSGTRNSSVFSRMAAKGIDCLVVAAILFLGKAWFPILGLAAAMLFCAIQDALGEGQSIGKRIMGLRVIEDQAGQPCSYANSVLRNIPFLVALGFGAETFLWVFFLVVALPLILFEVVVLFTVDSGVRLGDVLANTLVVEVEENGGAFTEK